MWENWEIGLVRNDSFTTFHVSTFIVGHLTHKLTLRHFLLQHLKIENCPNPFDNLTCTVEGFTTFHFHVLWHLAIKKTFSTFFYSTVGNWEIVVPILWCLLAHLPPLHFHVLWPPCNKLDIFHFLLHSTWNIRELSQSFWCLFSTLQTNWKQQSK